MDKRDSDLFRKAYLQEWSQSMIAEPDLAVLGRIIGDVEHSYNVNKPEYYIKSVDYLPFLRAVKKLIREHTQLSQEVISLGDRIDHDRPD